MESRLGVELLRRDFRMRWKFPGDGSLTEGRKKEVWKDEDEDHDGGMGTKNGRVGRGDQMAFDDDNNLLRCLFHGSRLCLYLTFQLKPMLCISNSVPQNGFECLHLLHTQLLHTFVLHISQKLPFQVRPQAPDRQIDTAKHPHSTKGTHTQYMEEEITFSNIRIFVIRRIRRTKTSKSALCRHLSKARQHQTPFVLPSPCVTTSPHATALLPRKEALFSSRGHIASRVSKRHITPVLPSARPPATPADKIDDLSEGKRPLYANIDNE